jgi:cell division protein FtsW (lipid II flippase)
MTATISSTAYAAQYAATSPSRRMPFSMPASTCMGMSAATASIITLETGVYTSVSLFMVVLLLCLCSLLLPRLVVLISLVLIGLTGLIRLESLVGLVTRLATTAP